MGECASLQRSHAKAFLDTHGQTKHLSKMGEKLGYK